SSRRRHTRFSRDWSSDVCSSDLLAELGDHLKALDLDPALPVERQPFMQVRLSRDGLGSGFRAEADRIAEQFPVRLVDLRLSPRRSEERRVGRGVWTGRVAYQGCS